MKSAKNEPQMTKSFRFTQDFPKSEIYITAVSNPHNNGNIGKKKWKSICLIEAPPMSHYLTPENTQKMPFWRL